MLSASSSTVFDCTARDERGRRKTLRLTAGSRNAAFKAMKRQGLFPVDARAVAEAAEASTGSLSDALPAKTTGAMVARLATLIERGIGAERAFMILSRDTDARLSKAAQAIRNALREGDKLADAMRHAGRIDDATTLALVSAGEASGALAEGLREADRLLSGRAKSRRALVSNLIYPMILSLVAFASISLVMLVIVPQFKPMLSGREDTIPAMGRMVFAVSDGFAVAAPWLGVTAIVMVILLTMRARQGRLGATFSGIIDRVPGIARSAREARVALLLRVLGTLMAKDVQIDRALKIAAGSAGDPELTAKLSDAGSRILRGEPIADTFSAVSLAPPAAIELIRAGEETGDLAPMLQRAADDIEETANARMQQILALCEPALILIIGLVIGVSLYALFTAISAVNAVDL